MTSQRLSVATGMESVSEYFSLDGHRNSFLSALSTVSSNSDEGLDDDIVNEYYRDDTHEFPPFYDEDIIYNEYATSTQLKLDSLQSFLSSTSSEHVPFEIVQTFRHGTYGIVHIAERIRTGRELVKIRIVSTGSHRTYESEELARELRAHQRIEQSGSKVSAGEQFVAKLLGNFDDPYFSFNVLEHHAISLEHPDIAELLLLPAIASRPPSTRSDRNPLTTLRLVAAEVTLGLLYLHSLDLVHQDIKPENLLVTGSGHILIGDLGACHVKSGKAFSHVTLGLASIVVFSPSYAAPELCHRQDGLVCYDERADWWSFGVTIHKLATATFPSINLIAGQVDINVPTTYAPLRELLIAVLVPNVGKRLSGLNIKHHRFFHSLEDTWEEIASLRYPPFQHVLAFDSEYSSGGDELQYRHGLEFSRNDTRYCRSSPLASKSSVPEYRYARPGQDDLSKSFIEPLPSSASYFQYRSPLRPLAARSMPLPSDVSSVKGQLSSAIPCSRKLLLNRPIPNDFSFSEPLTKAILTAMEVKSDAVRKVEERSRRMSSIGSFRRIWARTMGRIQTLWD